MYGLQVYSLMSFGKSKHQCGHNPLKTERMHHCTSREVLHAPPTPESTYHYSVVLPLELDRNDIVAAGHLLSLAVFSQHND